MSNIVNMKDFMQEVVGEEKEIKMERFKSPFLIETISETENDRLKKSATVTRISKSGNRVKDLDVDKYGDALLVRCVKAPDLHNTELQTFYKTEGDASGTLKAMLLAGEYAKLTNQVLELNGFNEDEEVIKEEVKK
ncbi:phage tail assembly chaperone [Enterococcus sp. DIV1420a]|uniref:phage tail assembly chaperone n=1 Tax=Enterococcus sp. DIV1420a TaxID=2774672 RepID=UPI003F1E62C8